MSTLCNLSSNLLIASSWRVSFRFAFFNSSRTEALQGECCLEESLLEYEAIYKRKQQTK